MTKSGVTGACREAGSVICVNTPCGKACVASELGGPEACPFFSRAWSLVPHGFCPRKMEAAGANHWLLLQEAPTGSGGGLALPSRQLCTLLISLPAACIRSLEAAGDQPAGPKIPPGTCVLPDRQLLSVPALALPLEHLYQQAAGPRAFYTLVGGLLCSKFPGHSKR